ncbi:MAG: FG-GAP-like repeat-containing protein [Bacteroidota bacterium]
MLGSTALNAQEVGPPFEYRTFTAGLGGITGSNGVAVADVNRDGHLDLYIVVPDAYEAANTRTWNRLFLGLGGGLFRDATRESNLAGRNGTRPENTQGNGYKLGAAWGDYDNDGWPDLYLTHAGPNQLYRNNGNGTFTDVTAAAGVAGSLTHLSTSALWVDIDTDGDLDLHVGAWEDYPQDGEPLDRRNELYENLGDGTFAEVAATLGVDDGGKTYTTLAFDVNGDGRVDLYSANDFGQNRLFVQQPNGSFREETDAYGLVDGGHGMGLALGDPNGDGRFDVYLTNISGEPSGGVEEHALFVARPDGGFRNEAEATGVEETGWGWGTAFFDFDNDGDEDLFVGNGYFEPNDPNALFENHSEAGPLAFANVAEPLGIADEDPARGLAVFDLNDDGHLDLLAANVSGGPFLYENRHTEGHWLAVALEGTTSNRDGLGATVEVWADGRQHRRLHHGGQFLGQSLVPVHVGLGEAQQVDRVVVRWPSGITESAESLVANQQLRFREGEGLVEGSPVSAEPEGTLPHRTSRLQFLGVGPNPSTRFVTFQFEATRPEHVTVNVYDGLGRLVHATRSVLTPGRNQLRWDARNTRQGRLAPGVYLYAVYAGAAHSTVYSGSLSIVW